MSDPGPLPPLYASWMKEALSAPPHLEPRARCEDCSMMEARAGEHADLFFNPSTKCCTFIPSLPNYLVGLILLEEPGQQSLIRRIKQKKAVTPLGLGLTLGFALRYRHDRNAFGRRLELRCPHYVEEGGLCGIWRYRNATCSTWFCKHERGFVALLYWRALRELLAAIERGLGAWCVKAMDMVNEEVLKAYAAGDPPLWNVRSPMAGHMLHGQLEGEGSPRPRLGLTDRRTYERLWGEWQGREEAFYIECAKLVKTLNWQDVLREIGAHITQELEAVQKASAAMADRALPERLQQRPLELVKIGGGRATAAAYSAYDPLEMSEALLKLLERFDGRPTQRTRQALLEEGVELSDALLLKLVDHRLLEEP